MTGLLIKDVYNLRKQIIWYLGLLPVFFVLSLFTDNVSFVAAVCLLVPVTVTMSAVSYEEKESWQKFVVASGTDVRTIVLEKYLLGLAFGAVCAAVYLIAFAIKGEMWSRFVLPIAISVVVLSVVLPLIFRFGVEKGKPVIILVVLATLGIWIALLLILEKELGVSEALVISLSTVFAVLSLAVSYCVSVRIYRRKEF